MSSKVEGGSPCFRSCFGRCKPTRTKIKDIVNDYSEKRIKAGFHHGNAKLKKAYTKLMTGYTPDEIKKNEGILTRESKEKINFSQACDDINEARKQLFIESRVESE